MISQEGPSDFHPFFSLDFQFKEVGTYIIPLC